MSPLVEQAVVAAILMGAAGYLLSRFIRRRRAGKGCGNDCGCGATKKSPLER